MTFTSIAEDLRNGIDSPELVQTYRNFCASWMYTLHNQYGQLKAEAAVWLTKHREEYKSYAECERAWDATEQGTKKIEIKHTLEGLHELQEALKSQHYLLMREWRARGEGEG